MTDDLKAGWQPIERAEMPKHREVKLKEFAFNWLNGPLPADLMADLADILEDEDFPPEKRAHQIVWQAVKWGMESTE